MKPDWDQLIDLYDSHESVLIADVDCTSEGGRPLCNKVGVRGYPTVKYGDPNDLQDYQGGRDYAALKEFAEGLGEGLVPEVEASEKVQAPEETEEDRALKAKILKEKVKNLKLPDLLEGECSPANIELCDTRTKRLIEKFQRLSDDQRQGMIEASETDITQIEDELIEIEADLENQNGEAREKTDQALKEKKDEKDQALKALALLQAVHAQEALQGTSNVEL